MSRDSFSILIAILGVIAVGRGILAIVREFQTSGRTKWMVGVMGLLMIVGVAGFYASFLAALGFVDFAPSFEWPAGYVNGVVKTLEGVYVVHSYQAAGSSMFVPTSSFLLIFSSPLLCSAATGGAGMLLVKKLRTT